MIALVDDDRNILASVSIALEGKAIAFKPTPTVRPPSTG